MPTRTQEMPKISIVTPSFNHAGFIEEALLSVKKQNYPNLEHIVVDGGSTDGTLEILQRYGSQPGWGHLRWTSEPDHGQSDALNKGFRLAQGDIVGWLNSDDRYRVGCLQKIVQAFSTHSQADVIYGDYTWIDQQGRVLRIRREIRFSQFILSYLHLLYVPTTSSFFRRRIFDEGNWIDLNFYCAMDYEFVLRLAQKGYKFQHVSGLVADFRVHDGSKSVAFRKRSLSEHNEIALAHVRFLQHFSGDKVRRVVLATLRIAARALRYSEKLLRGYYFDQFRPSLPGVLRWRDEHCPQ